MRDWTNTGKDVSGRNDCGRGDFDLFGCDGVMGNAGGFLVYYLVKSEEQGLCFLEGLY